MKEVRPILIRLLFFFFFLGSFGVPFGKISRLLLNITYLIKGVRLFRKGNRSYVDGGVLGSLYIISRVTAPSSSPVFAVRGFPWYGRKSIGPVRVRTATGANFQRRRCSQPKNRWSRSPRKAQRPRPKVSRQNAVPANAIYRMFFETRERNGS